MHEQIKKALEHLYFVEPEELDDRAIAEIARFIAQDDHELDQPKWSGPLMDSWINEHVDQIHWLYEYLTKSTNVIYGGCR